MSKKAQQFGFLAIILFAVTAFMSIVSARMGFIPETGSTFLLVIAVAITMVSVLSIHYAVWEMHVPGLMPHPVKTKKLDSKVLKTIVKKAAVKTPSLKEEIGDLPPAKPSKKKHSLSFGKIKEEIGDLPPAKPPKRKHHFSLGKLLPKFSESKIKAPKPIEDDKDLSKTRLTKYINNCLAMGHNPESILQALSRAGWRKELIDESLNILEEKHLNK